MNKSTFTFDQLSPEAQAKALDTCRDHNTNDSFWYENLNEGDLVPFLELLGFEQPVINFSLGYCQGDYASIYSSNFHYSKGFVKKVKELFPTLTKRHELAEQLQDICKRYFYGYSFSVKNARTCDFEHKTWGGDWQHNIAPFEAEIDSFMYDLNRMIYESYRDEYEALRSDENIKELLLDEEYLFFEDGTDRKVVYANAA